VPSFCLLPSLELATPIGAGAIETCGVANDVLFLLGWSSARCSSCMPSRFGSASMLAAGGSMIPVLTFLGELGLWLLAGVDVSRALMLDDIVGPLEPEAAVDGTLPPIGQAVLTIGSKLLIPGTSGMEELYCGRGIVDATKLSTLAEVAGWAGHGPWWNPATPPPPGPGAAGWSKRASKSPGSIGSVLVLSKPNGSKSGG